MLVSVNVGGYICVTGVPLSSAAEAQPPINNNPVSSNAHKACLTSMACLSLFEGAYSVCSKSLSIRPTALLLMPVC